MTRARLAVLAVATASNQWAPILGAWGFFEVVRILWQFFVDAE